MLTTSTQKYFGIFAIAITFVLSLSILAVAKETPTETVVAIVNGNKILKQDVAAAFKNLQVKPEDETKAFPVVLDQVINEKLFSAETVKAKVEDTPEFKQRLEAAKEQLIKSVYLDNYLKAEITDKVVKDEYAKFKKENKGKEEVRARHILVSTEDEAKQVIKDLEAGANFAELAKKRSSGPTAQNGGDVGYFAKGEIIPQFSDAAFKLKKGQYTKEAVKSDFGWHVILVEDKRDRVVPEMKDVEAAIRNKLSQQAIEKLVNGLRAKADIKRFDMDGKPVEAATPEKKG